jgi:tRNA(Ile)-lysidine synthase
VRPLIETTREETEAFCRALGFRPRRDPMNEDPSFMRVAIRTKVIPSLERALGRNVRATLARTAALLREDAELLERMAEGADAKVEERPGEVLLRAAALVALPRPLAGRIVRRAVMQLGVLPEAGHVAAVLGLASSVRGGGKISLPDGLVAGREREYVRLVRPSSAAAPDPADRRRHI